MVLHEYLVTILLIIKLPYLPCVLVIHVFIKIVLTYFTEKPFSDAMRTQPHLVDADGRVFWKLNSHTGGEGGVLLQG